MGLVGLVLFGHVGTGDTCCLLLGQVGLVALAGLVGDVALMGVMALVGFVALVDLVAIVGLPFVFSKYQFFRFLFGMF